jgi:hypothetical protein
MKLETGKYTEITDLAFEINPDYKKESYIRFFVCPDVLDIWLVRILDGFNEEYEKEEGILLLERNNIPKQYKGYTVGINDIKRIIKEDNGENWDIKEYTDIDDIIDDLDSGFGINNLKG